MEGKQFKTYVPGAKANKNEKYEVSEAAKTWAAANIQSCTDKKVSKDQVFYRHAGAYRSRDGLLQLKMHSIHWKADRRLDLSKKTGSQ